MRGSRRQRDHLNRKKRDANRPHGRRLELRIDRQALHRVLSANPVILEALEKGALKATGRPGANVAQMWLLSRRALYASADVPVLGTREACQNGIDGIRAAIKARQIKDGAGRFAVTWDPDERTLTWEDNGQGMTAETILTKFLVLGNTGKSGASSSDEAAGGFGVAKAVILGTASRFRWQMTTRDNLVISQGADSDVEIFEARERLQGCRITVFDVSPEYDLWWDSAGGGRRPIEDRLKELLAANDLPGITLTLNGEEVRPLFSRRGGSRIKVVGSWGEGTTATIKAYKRPDRRGAYWVRINGLYQFKSSSSGDLGVDVVVDVVTTVRPGEANYPFNAGRDALQGQARYTFRALVEEVERENASVGDQQDDEVFDPELDEDGELEGDAQELTRSLMDDPELAKVLEEAGLDMARPESSLDADSLIRPEPSELPGESAGTFTGSVRGSAGWGDATEPGDISSPGSPYPRDSGERAPEDRPSDSPAAGRPVLKTDLPDDFELSLTPYKGRLPWFPAGLQTVQAIRRALDRAEGESPYEIHPQAIEALDSATAGAVTVGQLRIIATEMDRAARTIAQVRGLDRPQVQVVERKQKRGNGNPFGHLGALRVSRTNYDKAKARAFKRSPRKYLPMLVLWDTTLKLVAHAGSILRPVKPGFVLEDGVVGLAQRRPNSQLNVVYIHPDRLTEAIERNRERPLAIAAFLHGVASHELTHVDGRMGEGHSESFISAREDLGSRTAYLLPQLSSIATRLLKLPEPKDPTAVKLAKLERQLEKAKDGRDTARAEKAKTVREMERELAACRREIEARGLEASAQTRADCTGSCGCRTRSSAPAIPATVKVERPPGNAPLTAATDPAIRERAERAFSRVRVGLLDNRPGNVSVEYVEAFLARYQELLLERLASALERPRMPTHGEVVEPLLRRKLGRTTGTGARQEATR